MSKLNWAKQACFTFLLCATTAITLPAQNPRAIFTTLHSFDGTDGSGPSAAWVQATDGSLYGTTFSGGANSSCNYFGSQGCGTVFKLTPSGTLATLYSFCSQSGCSDGSNPGGVVQSTEGNFYGTTLNGGVSGCFGYGCGTVFKVTPSGALTTLYRFCSQSLCADGDNPQAGLVQATDGNFYGTTTGGGANGSGTIFKITRSGALATLYNFCSQSACTDGGFATGTLIQARDGNLYGTTGAGGAYGAGTVFRITPKGTLTTLHNFCSQSGCADGASPYGALVQSSDGDFYGTTEGETFSNGTVFKITQGGTLTTLHNFCSQSGCADGSNPLAGLVQATDGNFYGTTSAGGTTSFDCVFLGCGTVFKITPSGTLTTLYDFCSQSGCADGYSPAAALTQDTNGKFYGTTCGGDCGGASSGYGTVFTLAVGLGPFVETQPTSGKVGRVIKILGTNLTGAHSVTFNGTPAVFIVEAKSLIKATVPTGATSGIVQVVTPSGTLSSNVPFRVIP